MNATELSIGTRIKIALNRNPDRIGKLATIIGHRRPGRAPDGSARYVHPVDIDGVGTTGPNGKPLAVEDGTFEIVNGCATLVRDEMSAAYALRLYATGDADGPVGEDGIVRLDCEIGAVGGREGQMTQARIDEINAHEAYWRSLTEDSDAIARDKRRAEINATARRISEPAPVQMPPLPPKQPWYENLISLAGGGFIGAVVILLIIFACLVKW